MFELALLVLADAAATGLHVFDRARRWEAHVRASSPRGRGRGLVLLTHLNYGWAGARKRVPPFAEQQLVAGQLGRR